MSYKSVLFYACIISTFCIFVFGTCKDDPEHMDEEIIEMMNDTMDVSIIDTMQVLFKDTIRFASYNVALFRSIEGQLITNLGNSDSDQINKVAEIIQRVRPDVLALMEFDYDENGEALDLFQDNYLAMEHNGAQAIEYPYAYAVPSNTGVLSEIDLNSSGNISLPNDAYGFGEFPGQYAFALLSKYRIDVENLRSFQNFLWKDMPDASLPVKPNGDSYYPDEVLDVFRVSSKNHIDLPVEVEPGEFIHVLLSHPTPPVFDGAEDRNGLRNHDEIRLFADYISNSEYLVDDNGQSGGLAIDKSFVIMGDLNADPVDGDSADDAILQLLNHPNVNSDITTGDKVPASAGGTEHNQSSGDQGDPQFDTSFFGLRIDYIIPSKDLEVLDSGCFWPASSDDLGYLTNNQASSDHLLIWADLIYEE